MSPRTLPTAHARLATATAHGRQERSTRREDALTDAQMHADAIRGRGASQPLVDLLGWFVSWLCSMGLQERKGRSRLLFFLSCLFLFCGAAVGTWRFSLQLAVAPVVRVRRG